MKSLVTVFKTEGEKRLTITVPYASPEITSAEGTAKVKAFVAAVLANQPFSSTLVSCEGASMKEVTSTEITVTEA